LLQIPIQLPTMPPECEPRILEQGS
jgi:hypothetical protein